MRDVPQERGAAVRQRRISFLGVLLLFGLSAGGCAMTGAYQNARILEKGTSNLGLGFALHRISIDSTSVVLPAILPEISYHLGVSRNWEVGGRVALGSLGIGADCKYRFLHGDRLDLAVAPSLTYQGVFFMSGLTAGVPFLGTLDFSERHSLNFALFGSYSHVSSTDQDMEDALKEVGGEVGTWGIALGPEIRGESFFMRPWVEFARSYPLTESENRWPPYNRLSVTAQIGWIMGQKNRQLNQIEQKLDKALEKKAE
jgi:hypothetical protein